MADLAAASMPWTVLALAVPLAGAFCCFIAGAFAARVAILAAGLATFAALMAAGQVWLHGPLAVMAGGWAPPLGIALRLDGLSAALLAMTAVVTAAVLLFAQKDFAPAPGDARRTAAAFWPLALLLWAGLNAVFLASDLFNIYVALEMVTLAAVAMVALDGKAETLAAAIRYLMVALFGSLAYLAGVALLYGAYGTLDMALLRAAVEADGVTRLAAALMTAGLIAKTALFPLHAWLPPAHAGAPAPASALLSALVVKASFYLIVRIWFDILPVAGTAALAQGLGALGACAILYGSLQALRQERLKLIVAYSTVAQLGYLFLMFPLAGGGGEPEPWVAGAWSGGIFHVLAHALAKAAMFLAAGVIAQAAGHDRLDGLAGIARDLPVAMFAFGIAALSLMGLPPSGGFTAKYLLLTASMASGQWWWAVVMVAGGLLAAAYLFRPLNCAFAEVENPAPRKPVRTGPQAVALALAAGSVLLGLASYGPYEFLQIGRAPEAEEAFE